MSYKAKESYGTVLGGCLSCCATMFVITYVGLVLAAFFIGGKDYDESVLKLYNPVESPDVYSLSPNQLIPSVQVA